MDVVGPRRFRPASVVKVAVGLQRLVARQRTIHATLPARAATMANPRLGKRMSSEEVVVMLVLTRRPGEAIIINGEIQVTVVALQGGKIRLGIEAPEWMTVDRKEVHERRIEFLEEGTQEPVI